MRNFTIEHKGHLFHANTPLEIAEIINIEPDHIDYYYFKHSGKKKN